MAYIKNTWVDREGVTRYFETVDEDGALILTPNYEQVTEIGTPVNADNMNHIEDGIEDHENRITVLENAEGGDLYVNKSGDTMSGNLEFVDNKSIYPYNSTLAIEDTPSTDYSGLIAGYADKNKARKSHIASYWSKNGARGISISEKKSSTENTYATLSLGFDTNGQAFATAPASVNQNSIVTTLGINKASSGYVKFGNGIIIQWGTATVASGSTSVTVTLPISFSSTNYRITAHHASTSNVAPSHTAICVAVSSASKFVLTHQNAYTNGNLTRYWIAIGY